jgi:streptogramin lyase
MNSSKVFTALSLFFVSAGSVMLSGCAGGLPAFPDVDTSVTQATAIGNLQGRTYGGQQAIYNSRVYLMKASFSGYAGASISILKASANTLQDSSGNYYTTSDAAGNFNITGDYTCNYNVTTPALSDEVYILSVGGVDNYLSTNPTTTGSNNPMIGLMAVLGQCPSNGTFYGHIPFIYVNEVSTVAAAYALAGFASGSSNVGAPSSAAQGMTNAFANAANLYDIGGTTQGQEARLVTPGAGTTGKVPQALLDTIANILATCVNQTPTPAAIPTSGACQTLYNNTGNALDTATAAIYIAHHPGSNVAALYALQPNLVQFIDALTSQPKDFSVGINFSGNGLATPVDVAIDTDGSAWITSSANKASKLTSLGAAVAGSPFAVPTANYVAIDQLGNAWISSSGNNDIYELDKTGATVAGSPYINNDFSSPAAVANDGAGLTFVANPIGSLTLFGLLGQAGDVVKINTSGTSTSQSVYTSSVLTTTLFNNIPSNTQVAIDSAGFVWISGDGVNCTLLLLCFGQNVQKVSKTTFNLPVFTTSTGPCTLFICPTEKPQGIAIDSANQAWVAISGTTDELGKVSASGALTTYTGGGLSNPQGVAIDGANNIWVANTGNNSVSQFTSTGAAVTTSTGYTGGTLSTPINIDIDPSGDVWVTNSTGNSVTELIGIATPVIRPLSVAVSAKMLATRP